MGVKVQKGLPAITALEGEGVATGIVHGDSKPLRIAVLNLMPIKLTTETDLIRLLS